MLHESQRMLVVQSRGGPLASLTNKLALHLQSDIGVTVVGSKVSEWAGHEGWRNTVIQTVDANRPTLVANVLDGHPAIRFGGTHWLRSLSQVGVVAGDMPRMYVVGSFAATGTSYAGTLASYDNTAVINRGFISFHNVADQGFNTLRGGLLRQVAVTTAMGNNSVPHLFDGRNDPTACVLAINGIDRGNFPAAGGLDFTPDNINIGRTPSGVLALVGDVFCVMVMNNPTPTSHAVIMQYLASQYPSLGLGTLKPLGTKLALDLDADIGVTAVAGKVSQWSDQSSWANHVAQATGANQPTLVPAVLDGHAAIRFDGAQWLARTPDFAGLGVGSRGRIYCVGAYDDPFPGVACDMVSLSDQTLAYRNRMYNNNGHFYIVRNPPASDGVGSTAATAGYGGAPALLGARDSGTNVFVTVNGVDGGTATASPGAMNSALNKFVVGANYSFVSLLRGRIVRLIIVDNPTAAEHAYIMGVIKARYPSLPLP